MHTFEDEIEAVREMRETPRTLHMFKSILLNFVHCLVSVIYGNNFGYWFYFHLEAAGT
jgi:hypothetical protein